MTNCQEASKARLWSGSITDEGCEWQLDCLFDAFNVREGEVEVEFDPLASNLKSILTVPGVVNGDWVRGFIEGRVDKYYSEESCGVHSQEVS